MAGTGNNHLLYQQPFQPTDNLYYRLQEGLQRARYGDFMAALVLHTTVILEQASLLRELMRDSRALYNKIVENAQVVKNLETKTNNIERHVSLIEQKLNLHDLAPCAPPPPHAQPPCGIYPGYERTFNEQPVHAMCGQDQQPPLVSLARMTQNQRLVEEHFQRSGIPRPSMPPRPPHPHSSSTFSPNFPNAPMYTVQRPVNSQPPFQMLPNSVTITESVVSHQQSTKSPVNDVFPHLVLPEGITIIPINPDKNQDKNTSQNEHRSPHDQNLQLMHSASIPSMTPQFHPPPTSVIIQPSNELSVKPQEPPIISITPARANAPAELLQKRRRKPLSSNLISTEIINQLPDQHLERQDIHTYVHSNNIQRHKSTSQVSITSSHRNPIVSLPSRIHFEASAQTNNVTLTLEEYNTHQVTKKQSYNKSMNLDRLLQKITELSHNRPVNDSNINNERNLTEIVPVGCVGSRRRKNICKTTREKMRYCDRFSDNPVDLTTTVLHVNENIPVSIDNMDKSTDIDSTLPIIVSVSGAVNLDSIIHNNEDDQDIEEDIYPDIATTTSLDDISENPVSIFTPEIVLTEINSEDDVTNSPLNLRIDHNWNRIRKVSKSPSTRISRKIPSRSSNGVLSNSNKSVSTRKQDKILSSFTSNDSSIIEDDDIDLHDNNHENEGSQSSTICCSFKSRLISDYQTEESDFEDLEIVVQEIISELVLCVENRFLSLDNDFPNMLYTENMIYDCKEISEENSEIGELHSEDVNDSQKCVADEITIERLENTGNYQNSETLEINDLLTKTIINKNARSSHLPAVINVDDNRSLLTNKSLNVNTSQNILESGNYLEANEPENENSQTNSKSNSETFVCTKQQKLLPNSTNVTESIVDHKDRSVVTVTEDENVSNSAKVKDTNCNKNLPEIPQIEKDVNENDAYQGHKDTEKDIQPRSDNHEDNSNKNRIDCQAVDRVDKEENSVLDNNKELNSMLNNHLDLNESEIMRPEKAIDISSSTALNADIEPLSCTQQVNINENQAKETYNLDDNLQHEANNGTITNKATTERISDISNECKTREIGKTCNKKAGGILSDKKSKKEHRKVKFADEFLTENHQKMSKKDNFKEVSVSNVYEGPLAEFDNTERQLSNEEEKTGYVCVENDLQGVNKNLNINANDHSILSDINDSIFDKFHKKGELSLKENENSQSCIQINRSAKRNVFSIMEEIYNGCFSKTLKDTDNEVDNPQPCSSKTISKASMEITSEQNHSFKEIVSERSASEHRGDILHQIINKQSSEINKHSLNQAQRNDVTNELVKDTETINKSTEPSVTQGRSITTSPSSIKQISERTMKSSENKETNNKTSSPDKNKAVKQKKDISNHASGKKTESSERAEVITNNEKLTGKKSKNKSPTKGNSPIIKIKPVKQMMVGQRTDTSIQIIIQQNPESIKRKDGNKQSQKDSQNKDESCDSALSGKQQKDTKHKKNISSSTQQKLESSRSVEESLDNKENGNKAIVSKVNKQGKSDMPRYISNKTRDSGLLANKSNEKTNTEKTENKLHEITVDGDNASKSSSDEMHLGQKESSDDLVNIPSTRTSELVKPMTIKLTKKISKQLAIEQNSGRIKRKKSESFERSECVSVEEVNNQQTNNAVPEEVPPKDKSIEGSDNISDKCSSVEDNSKKILSETNYQSTEVVEEISKNIAIPQLTENINSNIKISEKTDKHSVDKNDVSLCDFHESSDEVINSNSSLIEMNSKVIEMTKEQSEFHNEEELNLEDTTENQDSVNACIVELSTKIHHTSTDKEKDMNLKTTSGNQDSNSSQIADLCTKTHHTSPDKEKEENNDCTAGNEMADSLTNVSENLMTDANQAEKKELSGKVNKVSVKKKSRIDPFYRKRRRRSKSKVNLKASPATETTVKKESVINKQTLKKKINLNVEPVRQSHRIKTRVLEKNSTSKLAGAKKGEQLIKKGKNKSISQKDTVTKNSKELTATSIRSRTLTNKSEENRNSISETTADTTVIKGSLKLRKDKAKIPNSDSIQTVNSKSSTPSEQIPQSSLDEIIEKSKPSRKINSSTIKTKSKKQEEVPKNKNSISEQSSQLSNSLVSLEAGANAATKSGTSKCKPQPSKSSPRILQMKLKLSGTESCDTTVSTSSSENGESLSQNAKSTEDSLLDNDKLKPDCLTEEGSVRKEPVPEENQTLVQGKLKKRKRMTVSQPESKTVKKSKNQLNLDNQSVIPSTLTENSEEPKSHGNESKSVKKLKVVHTTEEASKTRHEPKASVASNDISELSQTTDKICINEIIRLLDRNIEAGEDVENKSENGEDMENAVTLTRAIRIWEEHDYSRFPIEVLRSSEDESTDTEMADGKSEKQMNAKTASDDASIKTSSKPADNKNSESGLKSNSESDESNNFQQVLTTKESNSVGSESCSGLAVQTGDHSSENIFEKPNTAVPIDSEQQQKCCNDKIEINSQRHVTTSNEESSSVSKSVKDSSQPSHSASLTSPTVSESPVTLASCAAVGERSSSSDVNVKKQDGEDDALKFKQIIRSKFQNKLKIDSPKESPIGDNYMTVLKAILQKRNILGDVNSLIPEQYVNFQTLKHRLSSAMSGASIKPGQQSTSDESTLQPQVQCVNIFTIHEIWKYLKCFINDPSRASLLLRHLGQKEIQQFLVLGKLCLLQAQQDETDLIFKKTTNTQDLTVEMLEKAIQLLEEGATE